MSLRKPKRHQRPDDVDIELDDANYLTENDHNQLAFEAGYMTDDEADAAGLTVWWDGWER